MEKIFLLSKPKIAYLRLFSSSLPFPKFWKQNLMYVKTWKSQYLNYIFQLNWRKYEKNVWYKIVYYLRIYKFESQHVFITCIFFFLI